VLDAKILKIALAKGAYPSLIRPSDNNEKHIYGEFESKGLGFGFSLGLEVLREVCGP
jgi:hypothetical protein